MRGLSAALLLAAVPAAAAFTGSPVLRRPLSARASALAEAFSAAPGGVSSMGTNPAGLAAAKEPALETGFASGVIDETFGFVGYARPVTRGTAGAGVVYYDAGKIEINRSAGASETRTAARDFVGLLSWALPVGESLSAGVQAKAFRFELAEEARAAGAAADLGVQWQVLRGLRLGAAAQNLGPNVKFESQSDPLPLTLRGGASLTIARVPRRDVEAYYAAARFQLNVDGVYVRDERPALAAGTEFSIDLSERSSVALRLGWLFNRDADGASAGVGLREGRWTLDYAMASKKALGNAHHVSLGARF